MWVTSKENVDLENSSPPVDQVNLVCTQWEADNDKDLIHSKSELFKIITSCDTNVCWYNFRKIVHPSIDDHQFSKDDFETVGEFELAAECAQVVLQCLYVARSGRPAVLWPVNTLTRAVTESSRACDNKIEQTPQLHKLICHIQTMLPCRKFSE